MAVLQPNPPVSESPVTSGKQSFNAWGVSPYVNPPSLGVVAGNWTGPNLTGPNYTPVISNLNPVTRIPRVALRAPAGAAADSAVYALANSAAQCPVSYPAGNFDGGFRVTMLAGLDAQVSTLLTTQFIYGVISGNNGGVVPPMAGAGGTITAAAYAWIGLYTNNNGVFRFGYKPLGSAIITDISGDIALTWAAYQAWKLTIQASPAGPRTFLTVAALNSQGTAFVTLASVSTNTFAPARVGFAPAFSLRKTTAGDNCEIWMSNAQVLGYTNGIASL